MNDPETILRERLAELDELVREDTARRDEVRTLLGRVTGEAPDDGEDGEAGPAAEPPPVARSDRPRRRGRRKSVDPDRVAELLAAGPANIIDLARRMPADPASVRKVLRAHPGRFRKAGPKLKDPWQLAGG